MINIVALLLSLAHTQSEILSFRVHFQDLKKASSFKTTRFSKVAAASDSLLGTYSRSRTIATLSLLEQEKLEEAKESLAQTALTLALLDVGGGIVLPVAEEITDYVKNMPEFAETRLAWKNYNKVLSDEVAKVASESVDKSAIRTAKQALKDALKVDADKFPRLSKVGKAFAKASKWFKGASVFEVLGPITDTLTIGLNIWGLEMAIRDNNSAGIAAASLSIAAGVVGLTTFFAAIITGSAVLGPIGAVVGAFLGIAATLIELFGGPGYDKQAVEDYKARLKELRNLRDACIAQIDSRMEFLDKVGSPYTDVYVNNQASSVVAARYGALDLFDCYYYKGIRGDRRSYCPQFKNSLHFRKFVGTNINDLREAKEELTNGKFVCMGNFRGIWSPYMPLESSSTGWGKDLGFIGFDFYGKFKKGTSYKGVHVFVSSDFVSGEELNDININTNIPAEVEQNDAISIADYKKFTKTGKITISTGAGSDCLNINGIIGELHNDYANLFTADLGGGWNVLSFQGISKDREDIKGVFFESKSGTVKYYHGENRNTHILGTVKNVLLFNGSPFDDHVIIFRSNMKVVQTSGTNVYEFNFDDLDQGKPWPSKFQIVDKSKQAPKINIKTSDPKKVRYIVLWYKKLVIFSTQGQKFRVVELDLDLETTGNLFINDANPRPIDYAHISSYYRDSKIVKFSFPPFPTNPQFENANELLLLEWITSHDLTSGDFMVDMKGGSNIVILSEKYFLEPSGFDGETVTLTLRQGSETGTYKIAIENPTDPSFSFNIELKNVERINNEYSDQLIYLQSYHGYTPTVPMDLFERYMDRTRRRLKVKTTEDVLEGED
ncbi:hypothetical protein AWC38_SpisGene15796 [Stylophora pistillata]|uniref:Uncharacterized protein n=1 Tax=Stylophora pistillata TaxID=50429 RepID=A0A2B4RU56_STYPI|nr:hypothetical protein AWC38_SpisGene15796 [Stylophora pistillata]